MNATRQIKRNYMTINTKGHEKHDIRISLAAKLHILLDVSRAFLSCLSHRYGLPILHVRVSMYVVVSGHYSHFIKSTGQIKGSFGHSE